MALLDKRRRALAAEGLFDAGAQAKLPFPPRVIGVVTSPTGAVIRDILHRLADRCPCHVLVWPVPVQGEGAADQIAAAVRGFNALPPAERSPRPDLMIVARGGGSIEDLWAFNEEDVVRAVAASDIPTISAVGHETDTSLCDFAADVRAPTPTAAAEMAVPVRGDLLGQLRELGHRIERCARRALERGRRAARGQPAPLAGARGAARAAAAAARRSRRPAAARPPRPARPRPRRARPSAGALRPGLLEAAPPPGARAARSALAGRRARPSRTGRSSAAMPGSRTGTARPWSRPSAAGGRRRLKLIFRDGDVAAEVAGSPAVEKPRRPSLTGMSRSSSPSCFEA